MITTYDKRVEAYIAQSPEFARPLLAHRRTLVHAACPTATEAVKWGKPFFEYNGKPLASMAAFQQHASFGFWHQGTGPVIEAAGIRPGDGAGHFGRLTRREDLPKDRAMTQFIHGAMRLLDSDAPAWNRRRLAPPGPGDTPPALAAALRKNSPAARQYEVMTPGRKREYHDWINEAKRPETQQKRLALAVAWIAEGKARNWQYENCRGVLKRAR